jgi:hypothetical protein
VLTGGMQKNGESFVLTYHGGNISGC